MYTFYIGCLVSIFQFGRGSYEFQVKVWERLTADLGLKFKRVRLLFSSFLNTVISEIGGSKATTFV